MALGCAPFRTLEAESAPPGNFRYIYGDPAHQAEFKPFLENVFQLYPEDELHALIGAVASTAGEDRDVYLDVQAQLDNVASLLASLRYALPAVQKHKKLLTEQTLKLLTPERLIEGYLEIGSNGRYLDALEERLTVVGERFLVSERAPTYSLVDMLDRGQIGQAGAFIPLDDYRPALAQIPRASLDLVTVYIGFHHCPVPLREPFLDAIRAVLKPGGALVVRDHDVYDEKMWHIVALAHDVFNLGTRESWAYNERELRNFYSLETLDGMLTGAGFAPTGQRLYQAGDPTRNALMLYRKA